MKKGSWLVVLLGVLALVMIPGMAGAQADFSCVGIGGTQCCILDGDGIPRVIDGRSHVVATPSTNDNVNATCHADWENVGPGGATVYMGRDYPKYPCTIYTDVGIFCTNNWHQVITPSGNVTLTCHFKEGDLCLGPH